MNIRELCIYIKNYFVNTYQYKMMPIVVISAIVFVGFVLTHLIRYKNVRQKPLKHWMAQILLSLEIATLVTTMLIRGTVASENQWRLQPFASYWLMIERKSMGTLAQIIMNVVVYIPFGFLLPYCFEKMQKIFHVIMITFVFSGCIELVQGVARIGLFEADDIMHNVLGATIGVEIYKLYEFTIGRLKR